MLQNLTRALLVACLAVALAACESSKIEPAKPNPAAQAAAAAADAAAARDKEAREIAIDAYVYGYPLVTMELTRRVSTNVDKPAGTRAPMGQLALLREYPNSSFRDVTAPNADTLYAFGWFDVSKEPWVVSLPDMQGRYALFPMLDGWTTVFDVPGKRTTGTKAQRYAITGPGWKGALPAGLTEYKSPTGMVWLLGRIYANGTPADYKAVHALQNKITAMPLSALGKPYTPAAGKADPALSMKAPRAQVHELEGAAYFSLLAELMKANPPTAEDAPMVARMARIGIVPGQAFDGSKLDPAVARAIADAPRPAQARIAGWMSEGVKAGDSKLVNGWLFTTETGVYGTNYLQRALIAQVGLGANRPQDAIYPTSQVDGEGKPYSGANKYVLRFEKGQLPPVDGFWSLTMYDSDFFFVPNPLNRYTLSQRDKLKVNADGTVDLYLQNQSPGKARESNWLPAPKENFILMLRLYWPKEKPPSILDGTWKLPPVKQLN